MTVSRKRSLALPLCTFLLAACGGGSDDGDRVDAGGGGDTDAGGDSGDVDAGGGSGGDLTCSVTAQIEPDLGARTMNGVGRIECDGSGTLTVETCVQWDSSGEFEDIQCQTSTRSGVAELEVENLASCGLGQGDSFRARVNAEANGASEAEVLSEEVGCE